MKVKIKNLEFDCIIGILPFERKKEQKVQIDIKFNYKFNKKNKDFVDYSKIVETVQKIMIEKKFKLLEEAIIFLENYLKKSYKIKNLKISIAKPNIITNCIVSLKNK